MEAALPEWSIKSTQASMNTRNPIRETAARINVPHDHAKPPLNLTFGDPSAFPDFAASPEAVQILVESLLSGKGNGYIPSLGTAEVRKALANYYSNKHYTLSLTTAQSTSEAVGPAITPSKLCAAQGTTI
jgi:aspartate/methionine/tyrosine aminotransferase